MRWAAFLILLLCSGGGMVLVMTWLAHNGVRQRHTLDRRLVLGHSVGAVIGVALFAGGIVRGNASLLRMATEVTSAAFVAGGLLSAGWLWRRQEAAWAAADAQRLEGHEAPGAADAAAADAGGAEGANLAGGAAGGFSRVRRLRLVFSAAATPDGELVTEQEPVELVAGDERTSAASTAGEMRSAIGRGHQRLRIVATGNGNGSVQAGGGGEVETDHQDGPAEAAEAALGDLSFAAAAFDWQAVGVRDDGTRADAHLPLAIVVAHGVTAFAALVLMFAAAG